MPVKNISGHLINDDPVPGFMITVREWNAFIGRIKRLADPLENAQAWAQTCAGLAVGLVGGLLALPDAGKHPVRLGIFVGLIAAFAVVAAFFFRLAKTQRARRPESVEVVCKDMEALRDEKAPKEEEA
jgi:hypothetical protein